MMSGKTFSAENMTFPAATVIVMAGSLITGMNVVDNFEDRLKAVEKESPTHVKVAKLDSDIKAIKVKMLTDKMSEIQSALIYYSTMETSGKMTPELRVNYTTRLSEMADAVSALNRLMIENDDG